MGLLANILAPIEHLYHTLPLYQSILLFVAALFGFAIAANVARQLFFKDRNAPPEVFHLIPGLGSTYVLKPPVFRRKVAGG